MLICEELPLAERMADEVLSLPPWPQMSEESCGRVVEAMRAALEEA